MKNIVITIIILFALSFINCTDKAQLKRENNAKIVSHYEVYDSTNKYIGTTIEKYMKDHEKFWVYTQYNYVYGIDRGTGNAIVSDNLNFSDYGCKGMTYKFVYFSSVKTDQLYIVKHGNKFRYFLAKGDPDSGYMFALQKQRISHSYLDKGICKKNNYGRVDAIEVEEIDGEKTGVVLKSKPPFKFVPVMSK